MSTSDIGTTVAIATGAPATNNKAGFEALTWVVIAGVVEAPAFATADAMIDVPDLQTGFTSQIKGAKTGASGSLAFREVASDAGQAAVETACNTRGNYSLRKITGTVYEYCTGTLSNFAPNPETVTSYAGASATFMANDVRVVTTAPT